MQILTITTEDLEIIQDQSSLDLGAESTPTSKPKFRIKWDAFLFIGGIHLAALAAFFTFSWQAVLLCAVLHWIGGGLGITLGYHRFFTHQSFKASPPVKYLLAILGTLNCQGGPISWVAAHRLHHLKSDQPGDPHSPKDGLFWSHMGWCMSKNSDIDNFPSYQRYAPDLAKDRFLVWLDKYHILPPFLLAVALYFWGGWPFVVWGTFVRTVFVYHCTWLVNSATHKWGYQTFKSNDDSMNLWWVALLSYGEGWHNNHHAFQTSARHGLKPWEIDTTYWVIKFLKALRLAREVKIPPQRLLHSFALAATK